MGRTQDPVGVEVSQLEMYGPWGMARPLPPQPSPLPEAPALLLCQESGVGRELWGGLWNVTFRCQQQRANLGEGHGGGWGITGSCLEWGAVCREPGEGWSLPAASQVGDISYWSCPPTPSFCELLTL